MKNYTKYGLLLFVGCLFIACQEDEPSLGQIIVPTNINVAADISTDGSGIVVFTASADNAITYTFKFNDGTSQVASSGKTTKRFTRVGLNTYDYSVVAFGSGGASSSASFQVTVESSFSDNEALEFLTGGTVDEEGTVNSGGSKTWYWAVSQNGHLGVGPTLAFDQQINPAPTQHWFPAFFAASPFQICSDVSQCLCNDELTFSLNAQGQFTYQLNNNGQTFFNAAHQQSVLGQSAGQDACFDFDTSGTRNVSLSPSETDWSLVGDPAFQPRGTVINFSNGGFMGYFIGSSAYEILQISENRMVVRTVDGLDSNLAWYHIFTTTPVEEQGNTGGGGDEATFDELIWSEEFDVSGAPDPNTWNFDLGTGENGWGNNELQYYTDRPENVIVADGLLKIRAKAESLNGSNYTSSRIQSHQKFEFQYGKVEVRAKLPTGGGTWPAIWTLGADFQTNIWPAAGEMDIMEHVGNQQNRIFATTHDPNNFGGNGRTGSVVIPDVSDAFHVYGMVWTASSIAFSVDGEVFHTVSNSPDLPFNKNFFFILNVAMGGNFGGSIDPAFVESTMEVDYIRVYQ